MLQSYLFVLATDVWSKIICVFLKREKEVYIFKTIHLNLFKKATRVRATIQ